MSIIRSSATAHSSSTSCGIISFNPSRRWNVPSEAGCWHWEDIGSKSTPWSWKLTERFSVASLETVTLKELLRALTWTDVLSLHRNDRIYQQNETMKQSHEYTECRFTKLTHISTSNIYWVISVKACVLLKKQRTGKGCVQQLQISTATVKWCMVSVPVRHLKGPPSQRAAIAKVCHRKDPTLTLTLGCLQWWPFAMAGCPQRYLCP